MKTDDALRLDPTASTPEQRPAKPSWKNSPAVHRALAVLAYLGGAFSLFYVFRQIKLVSLLSQYEHLKPGWLILAMLASMTIYLANTLRWLILLRPVLEEQGRPPKFWRTLQAVYIGLFFNEVLPLRPGEIIRCYLFSRWSGLSLSSTFASAVLERILDGFWMFTGFFLVAVLIHVPHNLLVGAEILFGGVLAGIAAWLILAQRTASRRKRALSDARRTGVKAEISEALELTGKPQTLVSAGLASALPISFNILSMWFLMKGAGFGLPLVAAMAVLLIIRVGTVIPNAPGNVGTYQLFCILALKLFGIDKTASAAFSLLSFGVFTVPLLVGGAIAVVASGFRMSTLMSAGKT